ncbi:MAG: hypothetical protein QM775_30695 [Pirellulales bacterium]
MMLLADRDDTLRFAWKSRFERESADAVAVYLDFPHTPVAQLTLELPEAYDVQRGDYVVQRSPRVVDKRYTWTLRGAGGRWRVRFAKRDSVQDIRRNGVRIESAYDFTERGVELTAQLRIDAVHAPLDTVTLDLDPGLTLVDARLPDRRITWYAAEVPPPTAPSKPVAPKQPNAKPALAPKPSASKPAAAAKPADAKAKPTPITSTPASQPTAVANRPAAANSSAGVARRYVLEFERPLVGTSRTLFIKAVAPLVVNRRHRLPSLRVADLFWNQATLTLSVPAPLEIVRIDPRECLFTNPVPLAGNRPGEAVEVQCFAPTSSVDLMLARRNRPIDAATVTLWSIRQEEASAEFRGEFRVDVGSRFTLEADLPEKWIIDGVVGSPATALADWSISDAAKGRRTLSVRLAQPLAADRPLRLTVTGRLKHHNVGDRLNRDQLRFVEFRNTVDPRPVHALRADDGLRLQPRNVPASATADAQRLDPTRRELLATFLPDLMLTGVDYWDLDVRRRQSEFTAAIDVDARVEPGPVQPAALHLVESYRLQLSGAPGAPLEQVRVRFVPAKNGPIDWTLGRQRSGQFSAVRVSPTAPSAPGGAPPNGAVAPPSEEIWELTFRKPIVGSLVLEARRESPLGEHSTVSPASVVDAAAQTGELRVSAAAAVPLRVINRGLTPLPSIGGPEAGADLRGAYRYQPSALTPDVAALEVASLKAAGGAPAVVWLLRYESKYDAGRRFEHRGTMYVQTFGKGRCRLEVDEPARLTAVRVNGVAQAKFGERDATLQFDDEAQLLRVEVDFVTSDEAAGRLRMLELPVLRVDVPLLLATRDVSLPATFDVPADAGLRSPRRDPGGLGLRRLFGPLVPAVPLDGVLSPADSWVGFEAPAFRLPSQPRETADIEAGYARLGAAYRELSAARSEEAEDVTWGEVFDAAERKLPSGAAVLRFDAAALQIAGVVRGASVTPPTALTANDRALGEQVLATPGLALVLGSGGLVVTSRSSAYSADNDALRVFSPSALSAARSGSVRLLTLADWKAESEGAWTRLQPAPALVAGEPQGQDYSLSLGSDAWGLWIVRREIPPLLALAFVAAGFVIARKLFISQRLALPPVAALFAIAAAMLPDWIGMAAASMLLGIAAGIMVCVVLPPRYRPRSRTLGVAAPAQADRSGRSTPSRAAVTGVLLLWLVPSQLAGQDADQPPASMVFIPVDASGKPTSDRYQVPQRLLEDLNARAAGDAALRPAAVVRNARYSAQVARDLEQSRYVVTEFHAVFELLVLRAPGQVTLPLGTGATPESGEIKMLPGFVDGRAVDLAVAAGGQGVSFDVMEAGPHRLEVTLRPTAPTVATSSFSLTVPRTADAELKVVAPPELADLVVTGAVEPLRRSTDRREAQARLAMIDKVSFSWAAQQSSAQSTSIDQLTWLRVRPGSIVLDLRLLVRPPASGIRELLLAADPRLQWLPKRGQDSLVADVEQTPITTEQAVVGQRVRLEFARPIVKEEIVEVSFLFTGGSGTGNMRLPELRLADETPGRKLFAYSVDPLLESTLLSAAGMKPAAIPEFLKTWGTSTLLPQAAFEYGAGANSWTLSVRPKRPVVEIRETQTIGCGPRHLDLALEAEVSVTAGLVYHHELQTPPGMTIDSVDVAEIGDDSGGRVGRWSLDEQGKLMVFLRAPIGETHRLTLRGKVPLPQSGAAEQRPTMPLATTLGGKLVQRDVRIARHADVLVSVENATDLKSTPLDGKDVGGTTMRVVEAFQVSGAKPAAVLKISPNPAHRVGAIGRHLRARRQSLAVRAASDARRAGRLARRIGIGVARSDRDAAGFDSVDAVRSRRRHGSDAATIDPATAAVDRRQVRISAPSRPYGSAPRRAVADGQVAASAASGTLRTAAASSRADAHSLGNVPTRPGATSASAARQPGRKSTTHIASPAATRRSCCGRLVAPVVRMCDWPNIARSPASTVRSPD